jgi:hypothetical protein
LIELSADSAGPRCYSALHDELRALAGKTFELAKVEDSVPYRRILEGGAPGKLITSA